MKLIEASQALLEYLGGSREAMPPNVPRFLGTAWFLGLWWALLVILILIFSGQKSKFIYIDF